MRKLIVLAILLFASLSWGQGIGPGGGMIGGQSQSIPNQTVTATLGSNLSPIDASCTGWTLGTGWACGGDGTIVKSGDGLGTASYDCSEADGTNYEVVFTTSGMTGSIIPSIGGATGKERNTNSTFTERIKARGTTNLTFTPNVTGTRVTIASLTTKAYTDATGDFTAQGDSTLYGDLNLEQASVLFKSGSRFIHNYAGAGSLGYNTFVGVNSGNFTLSPGAGANTLASYNVGLGDSTMSGITTGYSNTGLGMDALRSLTTGYFNTAVGADSMALNAITGYGNVAVGGDSIYSNTTGYWNTGLGTRSMWYNTTGDLNVAVGADSLYTNSIGDYNTAIGTQALYLATGNYNTALGYDAGANITTGTNNIIIGYNIDADSATADNQLNLGGLLKGDLSTLAATLGGNTDVVGNIRAMSGNVTANATGKGLEILYDSAADAAFLQSYDRTGGAYKPLNFYASNYGFYTSTFGTNAVKVLGLASGTAPTTSPADMIQIWSADFLGSAGDARLHIMGEGSATAKVVLGSGKITNQGTTGGYTKQIAEATATLSGASTTIQANVPTGSRILGVQLRVDTTVTSGDGATSWTAAYVNTPTTAICSGQAFAQNTKYSAIHGAYEITTGEVDINITPNSNTFSGGVIRAIVYYEAEDTMASL